MNKLAYISFLPTNWIESDIQKYFKKNDFDIQSIRIVKNRLGQSKGSAVLEFKDQEQNDNFIKMYDQQMIETDDVFKKIGVRYFQQQKIKVQKDEKTIYFFNLEYGCKSQDIYEMAYDFGEIENIDMPMNSLKDKNRGYAFITFKKSEQALAFQSYYHGKQYLGRALNLQIKENRFDTQKKDYKPKVDKVFGNHELDIKNVLEKENKKLLDSLQKQ